MNRRRLSILLVLLAVVVGAAACTTSQAEEADERSADRADESGSGGAAGDDSAATPTSTTIATVTLPDPEVGAGSCEMVVYTPPGAPERHEAELCVPTAATRRDVGIVLVHGGSGKFGDHNGVAPWAEAYTDEGYVTLAVTYHLFDLDDRSPVFPRPEQDIKAAVQFLRGSADALGLDPERILVQGLSAGARLGAVAFTTGNDPYFAGPSLWPDIPDHVNGFVGFYSTYDATLEDDGFYYGGERDDDDPEVRRRWAKADALANAGDATGPGVFFSGDDDWNVLITQMEQFVDALDEAGLEGQATVAEDGDHGFDQADGELTTSGEQALTGLLWWLDDRFPQD
jgi:acetyl esterase/lipase